MPRLLVHLSDSLVIWVKDNGQVHGAKGVLIQVS